MDRPLSFIHLSVAGHLDCFHIFAIVNIAALNILCTFLFEHLFSILFGLELILNCVKNTDEIPCLQGFKPRKGRKCLLKVENVRDA